MEKKTLEVIVGKKADEKDAALQGRKGVHGSPIPIEMHTGGEVAGRGIHLAPIICPWDHAINYVWVDDYLKHYYICWHCRGTFVA